MPRRARTSKALAARTAELAFAVPQVVAHRVLGMDSSEFHRMGIEKTFAFGESWNAMFMQAFVEQQRMAISLMTSLWFPWLAPKSRQSAARQLTSAAFGIAGAG